MIAKQFDILINGNRFIEQKNIWHLKKNSYSLRHTSLKARGR